MNLLLVLPPSLPEVVCSTLLIRCLKKQLAGVQLQVLCDAAFVFPLEANPFIDKLHAAAQAHTVFASGSFDVLIDLAALEENRHWAKNTGTRYLAPGAGGLFAALKALVGPNNPTPLAIQYLDAARPLGVRDDGWGLEAPVAEQAVVRPNDIPVAHSAGYLALVLQADMRLSQSAIQAFCSQVQHPIMLVGSRQMAAFAGSVSVIDPVKVYAACGKFSDAETSDLIRRAKLVVTPEGGWMQLAAAHKKSLVVLRSGERNSALFPPVFPQHLLGADKRPYSSVLVPQQVRSQAGREGQQLSAAEEKWLSQLVAVVVERL